MAEKVAQAIAGLDGLALEGEVGRVVGVVGFSGEGGADGGKGILEGDALVDGARLGKAGEGGEVVVVADGVCLGW